MHPPCQAVQGRFQAGSVNFSDVQLQEIQAKSRVINELSGPSEIRRVSEILTPYCKQEACQTSGINMTRVRV